MSWKSKWSLEEQEWDRKAREAEHKQPNKKLNVLPNMVGITPETSRALKWKSLKWMIQKDHDHFILKGFLKKPFKYLWEFFKSAIRSKPYLREGDFFLYGVQSIEQFEQLLQRDHSLLVLGFSYCQKPFECPSGRFTPNCIKNPQHIVCQQCDIGKALCASESEHTIPLIIPTIHYIGEKIFDIVHAHPDKMILFMISACEMTLEMFGDWGNMVNIQGVGIRLDGRICNTMKAFELSEKGIKPGLTLLLQPTQEKLMRLIQLRIDAQD